ncbi:MAG: endopeptidase La, partial [Nitrospirales bacterium]|nr:endopeptidase La [Nitrospirales bacterium]
RQLEEHGISTDILTVKESATRQVISHYTREAGVRSLEREIANLCRKVAKQVAEGKKKKFSITAANLEKFLGAPKYLPEEEMKKDEVGVSTGLAWTEAGGDVIFIEATLMKGRGHLTLTGQLGDVMKESAHAALSYIRSRAETLGLKEEIFSKTDLHIHVPAGAIPKDGPSAGITMATAIASALTGRPVRRDVAMTGEVTLRGRVLPIGGLKEKALAAKRMGITTVIVPHRNKKDLDELPKYVKEGMSFILAETMDDVLGKALGNARKPTRSGAAKPKKAAAAEASVTTNTRKARTAKVAHVREKAPAKGRVKSPQGRKKKI